MRRPILIICALMILSILIFDSIFGYGSDSLSELEGTSVWMEGEVTKVSMKDEEYYQLVIEDVIYGHESVRYGDKILVNVYEPLNQYLYLNGHRICFRGDITVPRERTNPRCFDYRKYLLSIGVRNIAETWHIEITENVSGITKAVLDLRSDTIVSLKKHLGEEEAGIVIGMLFGDKDYIQEDTMDLFRRQGTAHILAVSGMHIGILYSFLLLFRKKKRSLWGDIAIFSILLIYAALCMFSPSVMRAVLMIGIHMLGEHLNRRYDFMCCIAASCIFVLLINPHQIYAAGFQMSYLAAFTLAIIIPVLKDKVQGVLLPIIAIQAGMIPYVAYVFNYVSLGAIFSNLPVAYLSSFMIPAGFLDIFLVQLGLEGFSSKLLDFLSFVMMRCNEATYVGGFLTFDCISPPIQLLVCFYVILFFLVSESGRIARIRKNRRCILGVAALAIGAGLVIGICLDDGFDRCEVVFLDVGQGDSLHIQYEGKNILIDGGGRKNSDVGKNTLKPYLLKNGISHIDLAIATHLHQDHFKGISELSCCYPIDTLGIFEGSRNDDCLLDAKVDRLLLLSRGDRIPIGEEGYIEILAPEKGSKGNPEDENSECLVMKIVLEDLSILVTGDIDQEGERNVMAMNKNMKVDILKVAHHGSAYSSSEAFLRCTAPSVGIVSVGKNNYGHPSPETLNRLDENGISYYRTDERGAVGIDVNKEKIYTMR